MIVLSTHLQIEIISKCKSRLL